MKVFTDLKKFKKKTNIYFFDHIYLLVKLNINKYTLIELLYEIGKILSDFFILRIPQDFFAT